MAILKSPDYHFILSNHNKNGKRLIMVNFSYGYFEMKNGKKNYKALKLSTKQSIKPEYWKGDKANRKYVNKFGATLNNTLDTITTDLITELQNFRTLYERDPTPEELKKTFIGDIEHITKTSVIEYSKKLIDKKHKLPIGNKEHIGDGPKRQYLRLIKFLEEYEQEKEMKLYFEEFLDDTYWDIIVFIRQYGIKNRGEEYKTNYISGLSRKIITIFNHAEEDNIGIQFKTKNKRISEVDSATNIYLDNNELKKIINYSPKNEGERTARNFLILSSFTGLRITNMTECKGLKPIKYTKNGKTFLGISTPIISKTINATIIIPLLKPAHDVLKENNLVFPSFPSKKTIRDLIRDFLKNLGFNSLEEMKIITLEGTVTKLVEKNELFTPHDCRRTFITSMRQLGVRDNIIQKISHPKDDKSRDIMARYDKSTKVDNAHSFLTALDEKNNDLYQGSIIDNS